MESQKQSKRRNIIIAVVITLQVIVSLLFLMFAFYQRAEADAQRAAAEVNRQAAREAEVEAYKAHTLIDSLTIKLEKLKVTVQKK